MQGMKSNRQTATAATAFAERWKGIKYEKGGSQLHCIEFWRKRLAVYLDLLRMSVAWFLIQV